MDKKEFGEKILREAINSKINFINSHSDQLRAFNKHCDIIHISLSEKQFFYVKQAFNLNCVYVLCKGYEIDTFNFEGFECETTYNSRMSKYEISCTSKEYIHDFDLRMDYMESLN